MCLRLGYDHENHCLYHILFYPPTISVQSCWGNNLYHQHEGLYNKPNAHYLNYTNLLQLVEYEILHVRALLLGAYVNA